MIPNCDSIALFNKRTKSIKIKDKVLSLFTREQADDLTSLFPLPPSPVAPVRPSTAPAPQLQSQWKAAEGEEISDFEDILSEKSTTSPRSGSPVRPPGNFFELAGDERFPKQPPSSPIMSPKDDSRPSLIIPNHPASSRRPSTPTSTLSPAQDSFIRLSPPRSSDLPQGYQRLDFLSESYKRLDLFSEPTNGRMSGLSFTTPSWSPKPKDNAIPNQNKTKISPIRHSTIDKLVDQCTTGDAAYPQQHSRVPPTLPPTQPLPPLPPLTKRPSLSLFPVGDGQPRKDSNHSVALPSPLQKDQTERALSVSSQRDYYEKPLPTPPVTLPTPPPTPQIQHRIEPSNPPPLPSQSEQMKEFLQLAEQLKQLFQKWAVQEERAPSVEVTLKLCPPARNDGS